MGLIDFGNLGTGETYKAGIVEEASERKIL